MLVEELVGGLAGFGRASSSSSQSELPPEPEKARSPRGGGVVVGFATPCGGVMMVGGSASKSVTSTGITRVGWSPTPDGAPDACHESRFGNT